MRVFRISGRNASERVKLPNVAGMFYPGDGDALLREVDAHLERARTGGPAPKALIAPHAGYRYSGPIAASAYARLKSRSHEIRRVVLLGPAHYHPVRGVAASASDSFGTPLGNVPVDGPSVERALDLPFVHRLDAAFEREHSLEVHLPFLIRVLPRFTVVPLLVGTATPDEIDTLLEALWGGPETAIVISSDLSHYLDYETARRLDAETSEAIVELRHDDVGYDQACGRYAINGLLHLAKRRGLVGERSRRAQFRRHIGFSRPGRRLWRLCLLRAGRECTGPRRAAAPARNRRALDPGTVSNTAALRCRSR